MTDMDVEKTAILKVIRDLADIQTADEIAKFYHEDAVLYEAMIPGIYRGVYEIVAGYAWQMVDIGHCKMTIRELEIDLVGDLGFAYSVQHAVVEMKDGGVREATFRQTDILRKRANGWRIIHQHVSYPVDLATGKTVFVTPV